MNFPISIKTENLGKKYGTNRLFKGLNLHFEEPGSYAITGFNGSGKSTLLLCLAGFITPTEGRVWWAAKDRKNAISDPTPHFAFCSPALTLFEDLTMDEQLKSHNHFVKTFNLKNAYSDLERFELIKALHKPISSFSSGMKQRFKLVLALNNDVPVIFLDEPCSNLDERGISVYGEIITEKQGKKMILIATNQPVAEFPLKGNTLDLSAQFNHK
jgi:ABC-type multidrug transport system ATPase subunit